jgi:glutamyl-tRNA reductase
MIKGLLLWNFNSGTRPEQNFGSSSFILQTCQRTLVLAYDHYPFESQSLAPHSIHSGEEAYLFLLETICGLKSKLIGENEIVGQFKEAYKIYSQSTLKDTRLLLILEKLFKDAKDIRTQYLIGISQKTYASLARRHLIQRAKAQHIVIVGSGALAEDLINQFKKKAAISICARNHTRAQELAQQHGLNTILWEERHNLVNIPFIANTVGVESILFDEHFFDSWSYHHQQRLFVDLGSPSAIRTSLGLDQGLVRLGDIFNEGAILEGHKQTQIQLARAAMEEITLKRKALLEAKFKQSATVPTPQITQDMRYL